jgi:hypothetical protein
VKAKSQQATRKEEEKSNQVCLTRKFREKDEVVK